MAVKTQAQLTTQIQANLADNIVGDISPQDVREVNQDTVDSLFDRADTTDASKAPLNGPDFTGDASFDTDTLVVDSVNDRVGINTSSPNSALEIRHSSGETLVLNKTNGEPLVALGLNYATPYFAMEAISGGGARFYTGNGTLGQRMLLDASGNLLPVASSLLGSPSNPWGAIHTDTGIQLGGSGASNLLDDYEEGTWTSGFLNIGTGTYYSQGGLYTKVGNKVTVSSWTYVNAVGSASGILVLTGLPFTATSVPTAYSTGSIVGGSWTVPIADISVIINPSTNFINIYTGAPTVSIFSPTHADLGSGWVNITATYFTE